MLKRVLCALVLSLACVRDSRGATEVARLTPPGDIQAALDALGGTAGEVVLGPGTFRITSGLLFPDTLPICLRGAGPEATRIVCADPTVDIVTIRGSFSRLKDLSIVGPGLPGRGRGIVIGSDNADLTNVALEDLVVHGTAGPALRVGRYDDGAHITILTRVSNCLFRENASSTGALVYLAPGGTTTQFRSCSFTRYRGCAVAVIHHDGAVFDACNIEEPLANDQAGLVASSSHDLKVLHTWFENTTSHLNVRQISIDNTIGTDIEGCNFNSGSSYPCAISVGGNGGHDAGVRIVGCWAAVNGSPTGGDHVYVGPRVRSVLLDGGGVRDYVTRPLGSAAENLHPWTVKDSSRAAITLVRQVR